MPLEPALLCCPGKGQDQLSLTHTSASALQVRRGFREQYRPWTSAWLLVKTWATYTYVDTDPSCSKATDPDMALGSSMGLDINMASGGSVGHRINMATCSSTAYRHQHGLKPWTDHGHLNGFQW